MSKKIKAMELDALRGALTGARDYVIVEPIKVDAASDYEFRRKLREKSIRVQMVKNSYAKKIFGENMLKAGDVWAGPTLLCWGGASVKELSTTVDTVIKESKKDPKLPDKFKIKTGVADGEIVTLDVMKKLPTREEAISNLLGAILRPGGQLLAAVTGPGATLLAVVKAVEEAAEKGDDAAAADAPAADPAPVAS